MSTAYTEPNEKAIEKDVTAEVTQEIESAVAPLESSIPDVQAQADQAATVLGELFGSAITDASANAAKVRGDYNQALAAENAIMGEARDRLNNLRQSRAAEAQKLAQQIGGPVPLGEFTDPADLEASLFSSESAGSLLKATGLAQAGVQHAEAFSGRILPLLRTREIQATRAAFDKEILRIKGEIATLRAQKGGLINERTRTRLLEEREYNLKTAMANRDWEMAKKSAQLERDRLKLQAEEIYGGEVVYDPKTGTYKPKPGGKPTLGQKGLNADIAAAKAATEGARQAAIAERKASGYEIVEAYMNPGVETVKTTKFVPVAGPDAQGAFWNGQQWVRAITVNETIGRDPVTNPNELVQLLRGHGIPPALANEIIRSRFPDWTEGKAEGDPNKTKAEEEGRPPSRPGFTQQQLSGKSPAQLIKIARNMGFQQKVPPSIAKLQKTDRAEYNRRVKQFYIYWILNLQARNTPAPNRPEEGSRP